MRTILLTSASLMFTMGVALAQTSGMNNNGSTGTPGHAENPGMVSPAPGEIGSSPAASGGASAGALRGSSGMQNSNGSNENSPAMPGSNQTMPQRNSTMDKTMDQGHPSSGQSGMMHHHMMHHMAMSHRMGAGMPATASPTEYLHMAQQAIQHHQKNRAEDAIGRAETDIMNMPSSGQNGNPTENPQVETLSKARSAVMAGNYSEATNLIHQAMSDMQSGSMSNGMMNSNGMSNGSGMNKGGMNKGGMSNGSGMMNHQGMSNGGMSNGSGMSGQPGMSNGSGMSGQSGMENNQSPRPSTNTPAAGQ